jgi:hypothetical protein
MPALQLDFLLSKAGPVVRLRCLRELVPFPLPAEIERLQAAVCRTAQARLWLERLGPRTAFGDLHGSKPECFENALGKLVTLGLRAGCPELDQRAAPFRACLAEPPGPGLASPFCRMLLADFLFMAGYNDPPILAEVRRRLARISAFTRPGWRELYIDPAPYPDVPPAFRRRPLVNPEFYPANDSLYPLIYDLFAFAALYPVASASEREQIESVVDYVLLPEYQRIQDGYGIMRAGPRKYYSIGWDCKLPGFNGIDPGRLAGSFIQRLALMSVFPAARAHPWFRASIAHLALFASRDGAWLFPRAYLPEKPAGYWVSGFGMGLDENRRAPAAIEIESTFWMTRLLRDAV